MPEITLEELERMLAEVQRVQKDIADELERVGLPRAAAEVQARKLVRRKLLGLPEDPA